MRGSSSKDGKLHGNAQIVDRYDESKGHKPQRGSDTGGHSGGEHEASGHDEIKQVVADHGPASRVEITHGEGGEGGASKVVSHHGGHRHEAEFESAARAHAHAAHAGGVSDSGELNEAHVGNQEEDTVERASDRGGIEERPNKKHLGGGFMPEHGVD